MLSIQLTGLSNSDTKNPDFITLLAMVTIVLSVRIIQLLWTASVMDASATALGQLVLGAVLILKFNMASSRLLAIFFRKRKGNHILASLSCTCWRSEAIILLIRSKLA